MDDRELLELAALAAGIHLKPGFVERYGYYMADTLMWNPLTDDGAALRLAVKMGLHIDIQLSGWIEVAMPDGMSDVLEQLTGDPCAATRRAITRAAAEIGKTMEKRNG